MTNIKRHEFKITQYRISFSLRIQYEEDETDSVESHKRAKRTQT